MDGMIFANSLLSLHGNDLRMVYALLCRTNIGHLLSSKTKDLFSKEEQDHFTRHLEAEVLRLKGEEDTVLQVNLFLELTKLLKLRGTKYTLIQEIEDQCAAIVNDTYQLYQKQDKTFRAYTEGRADSTKLQQMIQYQMSKIFRELDGNFHEFSIEDQTKFASQVNDYINSLPADKQNKIKEKLGIDELTDEMVRKALATSGTSIVFAIIVEVSGFAFYTTAVSLVASFAGLFGLTLPFGFYTGLTSTIAVLANPLFLIPLLLGGGILLVNHQNKSLKQKLLPIIVMQVALPYMSQGADDVSPDAFIREWDRRYDEYCRLHNELGEVEKKQAEARVSIQDNETRIMKYQTLVSEDLSRVREAKQQIRQTLQKSQLDTLSISPTFDAHAKEYQQVSSKIRGLKHTKTSRPAATGFLSFLGNQLKNAATSLDIRDEEKKLSSLMDSMVLDVIHSKSIFMQTERELTVRSEANMKDLRASIKLEEEEKERWESILSSLNQENRTYTGRIKDMEKEHYGLADLHITHITK